MEGDKLAGMCAACGEWTFWTASGDNLNKGFKCSKCGNESLAHRKTAGFAILSQRTWDQERAKKESATWKKKLKR